MRNICRQSGYTLELGLLSFLYLSLFLMIQHPRSKTMIVPQTTGLLLSTDEIIQTPSRSLVICDCENFVSISSVQVCAVRGCGGSVGVSQVQGDRLPRHLLHPHRHGRHRARGGGHRWHFHPGHQVNRGNIAKSYWSLLLVLLLVLLLIVSFLVSLVLWS